MELYTAPPLSAEFPSNVHSTTLGELPPSFQIAPPRPLVELPRNAQRSILGEAPSTFAMAAPADVAPRASLPSNAQFLTTGEHPVLVMPAPTIAMVGPAIPFALPPVMVNPSSTASSLPVTTWNTPTVSPGPSLPSRMVAFTSQSLSVSESSAPANPPSSLTNGLSRIVSSPLCSNT